MLYSLICAHLCDEKGWIWAAFIIMLREKNSCFFKSDARPVRPAQFKYHFFICVTAEVSLR